MLKLVAFAKAFNLATPIKLLTHYTKGTQLLYYKLLLLIKLLLHFVLCELTAHINALSFTVLCAIAIFRVLSLRGWFPYIPTKYPSSYSFFLVYIIIL